MRTFFRLLLCGLVVGGIVRAAGPDKPEAGKVLILDNDRTLEGDIDKVGDQYRVRRALGVTWVPGDHVAGLCATREEALAFLRHRTNLNDPDERLRLARWCHLQGLRDQALVEVKAAVELRPGHAESKRLLQYLEQSARYAEEAARTPPQPPSPQTQGESPGIELTAEAMGVFATRVQPILMNACARCHLSEGAGTFQLQRTYATGMTNRKAMQHNLVAVLAQLNLRQPEFSPLLIKAVSAHGPTSEAPLRGRKAEAFRALEGWVRLALDGNPQLQDHTAPKTDSPTPPEKLPAPKATTQTPVAPTTPTGAAVSNAPSPTPIQPATSLPATGPKPPPAAVSEPESEFDPDLFNRQMHPGGKPLRK